MKLVARRKCAFGNGTRNPEFVFGTFEINKGVKPFDFERELILTNPLSDLKSGEVKLAEGVTAREFVSAFRNGTHTLRLDSGSKAKGEKSKTKKEPDDFRGILVADSDLTPAIKDSIDKAGIKSLGDLLDFGDENEGFQSIDGIAEASENQIVELLSGYVTD